jgi:hypothetical protein
MQAKYVRKIRAPERGTLIGVRLQRADLAQLDAWISQQPVGMSRPSAIRRILLDVLNKRRRP